MTGATHLPRHAWPPPGGPFPSPGRGAAPDPTPATPGHDDASGDDALARLRTAAALLDGDGRVLRANPALSHLLGYREGDLVGVALSSLAEPGSPPIDFAALACRLGADPAPARSEHRLLRRHGHAIWVMLGVSLPADGRRDGHVLVAEIEDIDARKREEEYRRFYASHDPVTSLPNRAVAEERLDWALVRAGWTADEVAVVWVDVAGFAGEAGATDRGERDRALRTIADRLVACAPADATIAHYGGTEFVLILDGDAAAAQADRLPERIAERVAAPIRLGAATVGLAVGIGVALRGADQRGAITLLREAKAAVSGVIASP